MQTCQAQNAQSKTSHISRAGFGFSKKVSYIALVSNVGKNRNVKVKVILLKAGNGKLIFWSIMRLTKSGKVKK